MMMMTGNWDNKVCRNFDYYGVPLIGCKEMQFKKYPTCNLTPCFPGQANFTVTVMTQVQDGTFILLIFC